MAGLQPMMHDGTLCSILSSGKRKAPAGPACCASRLAYASSALLCCTARCLSSSFLSLHCLRLLSSSPQSSSIVIRFHSILSHTVPNTFRQSGAVLSFGTRHFGLPTRVLESALRWARSFGKPLPANITPARYITCAYLAAIDKGAL